MAIAKETCAGLWMVIVMIVMMMTTTTPSCHAWLIPTTTTSTTRHQSLSRMYANHKHIQSFLVPTGSSSSSTATTTTDFSDTTSSLANQCSRRRLLTTTTTTSCVLFGTLLTGVGTPTVAQAVQPKNEALCGTGFFENIWQYKCTDLGDIQDEGIPSTLSLEQQGATDSLLDKLNLQLDEEDAPNNERTNEPKSKAAASSASRNDTGE